MADEKDLEAEAKEDQKQRVETWLAEAKEAIDLIADGDYDGDMEEACTTISRAIPYWASYISEGLVALENSPAYNAKGDDDDMTVEESREYFQQVMHNWASYLESGGNIVNNFYIVKNERPKTITIVAKIPVELDKRIQAVTTATIGYSRNQIIEIMLAESCHGWERHIADRKKED